MAIPKFEDFMLPVLQYMASTPQATKAEIRDPMIEHFKLTPEEAVALIPSQRLTLVTDRLAWSFNDLLRAGLLERPERAIYRITQRGRDVLAENPQRIDRKYLMRFSEFAEYSAKRQTGKPSGGDSSSGEGKTAQTAPSPALEEFEEPSALTPDERLEVAAKELQASIISDLKEEILRLNPTAFEKLILEVMRGLKYSARGNALHTGKSRDGGIDGIITEDALGLDSIYLQAKRYAESSVSRMEIQAFAGAMDEQAVTKGVFVTSSSFSKDAVDFAKRTPKHIRLINGNELVELMYDNNIGVRKHRSVEVKRIDQDFFKDLED
ncbi:MAG: restriction endonuclease [Deltaproteobacteria bacterium]|jgi:restriction system protein|nr:restriction endonuclease [Deltaproteobacteria bacterium]